MQVRWSAWRAWWAPAARSSPGRSSVTPGSITGRSRSTDDGCVCVSRGTPSRAGIGYAPEERKAEALFLDRSVRDNASIVVLPPVRTAAVRPPAAAEAGSGRRLHRASSRTNPVGEHDHPQAVWRQPAEGRARPLAREAAHGYSSSTSRPAVSTSGPRRRSTRSSLTWPEEVAVLVISSELPEVIGLADRIIVMQNGHITGELQRVEATEEVDARACHGRRPPVRTAGGSCMTAPTR